MKGTTRRIVSIAAAIALSLSLVTTPLGAGSVRADAGFSISGNVVGSAGNLDGISVSACTLTGSFCSGTTQTDASGNFSLGGLPAGSYVLAFRPSPVYQWGYYVGPGLTELYWSATLVDVSGGSVTLANVQLAIALSISGTVTGSAGGLGAIGIAACATDFAGTCAVGTVDDNGNFIVPGLAPDTYRLSIRDPTWTYATGFYGDSGFTPDYMAAAHIAVTDHDVALPTFELTLGISITGTVNGSAGALGGIFVDAWSIQGSGSETETDDSGHFTFRGFAPGDYRVCFDVGSGTYVGGCYTSNGLVPDDSVPPIAVGADGLTLSVDLQTAFSIDGTITNLTDNWHVNLSACPIAGGYCRPGGNVGGHFTVNGLAPGTYTLAFTDIGGRFASGYYSDSGVAVPDISQATPITVPPSVSGLTVALDMIVPGAPTDVTAIAGDGSATVSWVAPLDSGGGPVLAYYVLYPGYAGYCYTTTTNCTIYGLANGTTYTFTVQAHNAFGDGPWSAPSNAVTPVGQPVQQPQSIAFGPLAAASYGAAPITLAATASSSLPVGYSSVGPCSVSGTTLTLSGAGTCMVTASQDGNATWAAAAPASQSFTIAPAPLTISVGSVSRTSGAANPAFSPTYAGFVNGDTAASLSTLPSCATSATAASPVGTYPITCSGAASANYTFTYVAGTLTIAPVPLTITAPSAGRTYGAANPAFSPTYAGFVNGDTAASLSTLPSCATSATAASPVGTYPITCSGAASANYTFTYVAGTLTVAIADRFVTPTNKTLTVAAPGILALTNAPGATVVISTKPAGKLTLGSGGSFVYVPKAGFSGTDTFAYRLNVGGKLSAPVTVSIYVVGTGMNCARCNLSGLSMAGLSLKGANLSYANLAGTELDHANLTGANLSKATLANADLTNANLTGANLAGATLRGAIIKGVTWSSTTCPDGSNSSKDHGTCVGHLNP